MARFDGIQPIITADCTGPFARLDLKTGRSGYFFYETQGNCKVAKSMRVLHNKMGKKKDNDDDDNKGNNETEMQKQTKAKQRKLKKS